MTMQLFSGRLTGQVTVLAGHTVRILFDMVDALAEGVRWITGENSNDYSVEGNCDGWLHLDSVELPPPAPCVAVLSVVSGTAKVRLSRDLDNELDRVVTLADGIVTLTDTAEQANMVALVVEAVGGDVVIAAGTALIIG